MPPSGHPDDPHPSKPVGGKDVPDTMVPLNTQGEVDELSREETDHQVLLKEQEILDALLKEQEELELLLLDQAMMEEIELQEKLANEMMHMDFEKQKSIVNSTIPASSNLAPSFLVSKPLRNHIFGLSEHHVQKLLMTLRYKYISYIILYI